MIDRSTAFVVTYGNSSIFKVNLESGYSELLVSFPDDPGLTGIAAVDSSTAYVVGYNDNNIYRVSLTDGTYELVTPIPVGSPGTPSIEAITLASPTKAYVVGNQNNNVYSVDLETGESTLITSTPVEDGAALISAGFYRGKIYTVGNVSGRVYVIDPATGMSRAFATIPDAEGWAGGMGIFPGESTISLDNLIGNRLALARYFNDHGSDALLGALADLDAKQLGLALDSVAPIRNSLVTLVSQRALISSARISFKDLGDRRFLAGRGVCSWAHTTESEGEALLFDEGDRLSGYSLWAAPFFDRMDEKEYAELPAFNVWQGGGAAGIERRFGGAYTVGLSAAGVFSKIAQQNCMGDAKLRQGVLSLYGRCELDAFFLHGVLSGGRYSSENRRKINFRGIDKLATSSIDGWQFSPHLEIGYMNFKLFGNDAHCFKVEPFLSIDLVCNWENGYREVGAGDYNMGQEARVSNLFCLEHGVRLQQQIVCVDGEAVIKEKLSYVRHVPVGTEKMTAFLANSFDTFTFDIKSCAKNLGAIELSFIYMPFSRQLPYAGASYRVEVGVRHQAHRITFEVGIQF